MSRIFSRPMFKRGGSAGQGITSGLDRPGYAAGLDVQKIKELKEQTLGMYGQPPRGYNVNDFLIDWGLNMASATPQGNVIQTAAATAREPFKTLTKGKGEAEMAEYLSGVKATDQAISSLTDIAAARAAHQVKLRERTDDRIVLEDALKIQKEANDLYPGRLQNIAQTDSGSIGISQGRVNAKNERAKGHDDTANVRSELYAFDQATKTWEFDEQQLSTNKIWFDVNTKTYLTVTLDKDGKKVANYHTTPDEGRNFLKTHKKAAPVSSDKDDKDDKKTKKVVEKKGTTYEEMQAQTDENTKKLVEKLTTVVDVEDLKSDWAQTYKPIKNIDDKDFSELQKWWGSQGFTR